MNTQIVSRGVNCSTSFTQQIQKRFYFVHSIPICIIWIVVGILIVVEMKKS